MKLKNDLNFSIKNSRLKNSLGGSTRLSVLGVNDSNVKRFRP